MTKKAEKLNYCPSKIIKTTDGSNKDKMHNLITQVRANLQLIKNENEPTWNDYMEAAICLCSTLQSKPQMCASVILRIHFEAALENNTFFFNRKQGREYILQYWEIMEENWTKQHKSLNS